MFDFIGIPNRLESTGNEPKYRNKAKIVIFIMVILNYHYCCPFLFCFDFISTKFLPPVLMLKDTMHSQTQTGWNQRERNHFIGIKQKV